MPQIDFSDLTPAQLRAVDPEQLDHADAIEFAKALRSAPRSNQPTASDLYGGGAGSGAGGGTPVFSQRQGSRLDRHREFEEVFNSRPVDASGRPVLTAKSCNDYVASKLGSHLARSWRDQGLKRWQGIDPSEIDA
jgi:hypothetical protein